MPAAATRGPVPKRSTERRRRNKESEPSKVSVIAAAPVKPPEVDPQWHSIAADWFLSLRDSGQAQFFEPSDWQAARFVAEVMTRNLNGGKFSSVLFAAVWAAMNDLLSTEASRRRVRMEIERDPGVEQPAGVTALADYRKNLGVTKPKPKPKPKRTTAKKKSASSGSRKR
ncbi:MAG TPA: hypothetical protein VIL92_05765 [Gaiellaceae bacterium]